LADAGGKEGLKAQQTSTRTGTNKGRALERIQRWVGGWPHASICQARQANDKPRATKAAPNMLQLVSGLFGEKDGIGREGKPAGPSPARSYFLLTGTRFIPRILPATHLFRHTFGPTSAEEIPTAAWRTKLPTTMPWLQTATAIQPRKASPRTRPTPRLLFRASKPTTRQAR
jgi:hypothetical protein